jgi:MoCo/4Fe-4S cofactor protein with predicted Tat translocation signal
MSSLKDDGTPAETSDAASTARPRFWRSFSELNQSPEFRALLEREFAAPPETLPADAPERRTFLKLMGASLGLAGVGCRWKEDKILPLTRRPEGTVPGTTKRYATVMELDGVGVGLQVTSYDGRPFTRRAWAAPTPCTRRASSTSTIRTVAIVRCGAPAVRHRPRRSRPSPLS